MTDILISSIETPAKVFNGSKRRRPPGIGRAAAGSSRGTRARPD
jgi:hypothetical protein